MPKPPYIANYNFPLNFYDRPEVAFSNILRGNYPASLKAIFAPDHLSPDERKSLGDRYKDDPLLSNLVDVVTNPLVIMGVLLSMRFPPLGAAKMFKPAQLARGAASDLTRSASFLSVPDHLFAKYPKVVDAMHNIVIRLSRIKQEPMEKFILPIADKFRGLIGKSPVKEDQILVHHLMDGAAQKGGYLERTIYGFMRKHGRPSLAGQTLINPDWEIALKKLGYSSNHIKAIKDSAKISLAGYDDLAKNWLKMTEKGPAPEVAKALRENHFISETYHATDVGRIAKGGKRVLRPGVKMKDYVVHRMKGPRAILDDLPPERAAQAPDVVSGHMAARQGAMLPDMDDLAFFNEKLPGVLNPTVYNELVYMRKNWSGNFQGAVQRVFGQSNPKNIHANLKNMMTKQYGIPEDTAEALATRSARFARQPGGMMTAQQDFLRQTTSIGEIPQYSTRAFDDFVYYTHAVAPTYAATIIPAGATENLAGVIKNEINRIKTFDPTRAQMLRDDYLPMLTGRLTQKQAFRQMWFNNTKLKYFEALQTDGVKKIFNAIPGGENVRKGLSDILSDVSGTLTPQAINAKITSWLYFGALGINPSPAIKNLMQPVITLAPLVGWRSTMQGMSSLLPELAQYSKAVKKYKAQGRSWQVADNMAVQEVWPKFQEFGLHSHPEYAAEIAEETIKPWVSGAQKWAQGAKTGGMLMFTATERFNRLLSWKSGLAHAAQTAPEWFRMGQISDDAYNFAANVVRRTQFPSGIMGIPHGMLNLPGPFRQFTQFPLRMTDFLASSTKYGGENRRNWGTIGRALLYSTLGYEAVKRTAGIDISEASVVGALPAPLWREAPFYPLPLVPPALSMIGGVAHAAYSGDVSRLPQTLAVAAPGGLALQRAYKTLRPDRADYGAYQTTGKVPVYDKDGRLIEERSAVGMFMKTIGVRTIDERAETEMIQYLDKQKDILRQYRLAYLKALAENNLKKAEEISAEYSQRYPELGKLRVKKSDIETIQRNRQMNRIERVMRSMPVEYRELFGNMTAMAGAQTLSQGMQTGSIGLNLMGY